MSAMPQILIYRDPFLALSFPLRLISLFVFLGAVLYLICDFRKMLLFWNRNGVHKIKFSFSSVKFLLRRGILFNRISLNRNLFLSLLPGAIGLILAGVSYTVSFADSVSRSFAGAGILYSHAYGILIFLNNAGCVLCFVSILLLVVRKRTNLISFASLSGYISALTMLILFVFADSFRIALSASYDYESPAFLSGLLSSLFVSFSETALSDLYFAFYWTAFVLLSFFTAFLLKGESGRVVRSWINIFSSPSVLRNAGIKYSVDLASGNSGEDDPYPRMNKPVHLQQQDIMGLDSCVNCGLCDMNCPALIADSAISPYSLVKAVRNSLKADNKLPILADSFNLFSCVNCGACSDVCPSYIDLNSLLFRLKRDSVLNSGVFPENVKIKLKNIMYSGNIFSNDGETGTSDFLSTAPVYDGSQEYLLFAGCRARSGKSDKILKAFSEILSKSGISFGIMPSETCCGDYALRNGDEYLFGIQAEKNLTAINDIRASKIVFICPHGYNVFEKEYRNFAKFRSIKADYSVFTHVGLISSLLESGAITISKKAVSHVAFHDPCFLGRYNEEYDAPREFLRQYGDIYFTEPGNTKRRSFCCGYFSCDSTDSCSEITKLRTREIYSSGASVVVTACPHCADGILRAADELQIDNLIQEDFAEIVLRSIK